MISKIKRTQESNHRGKTAFEDPRIIKDVTKHESEPPAEQQLKMLVGHALCTHPEERSPDQLENLDKFFRKINFFKELKENHG